MYLILNVNTYQYCFSNVFITVALNRRETFDVPITFEAVGDNFVQEKTEILKTHIMLLHFS